MGKKLSNIVVAAVASITFTAGSVALEATDTTPTAAPAVEAASCEGPMSNWAAQWCLTQRANVLAEMYRIYLQAADKRVILTKSFANWSQLGGCDVSVQSANVYWYSTLWFYWQWYCQWQVWRY